MVGILKLNTLDGVEFDVLVECEGIGLPLHLVPVIVGAWESGETHGAMEGVEWWAD